MSTQRILRSLRSATNKPVQASVKGVIPSWLNGSLFRNGPGQFEFNNKYYEHLFDGAAVVNKFEIKNGEVFFSNKHIESTFYQKAKSQKNLVGQFGTTEQGTNIFGRLKEFFNPPTTTDNTNVNIMPYANKHMYAMTELSRINRINPDDLSLMNTTDLSDYLKVRTNIAHPQILKDGSWINMGLHIDKDRKGFYTFCKYQAGEKEAEAASLAENGKVIASIPSSHADGSSYFHSFGITENFIIFMEQPLKMVYKDRLKAALLKRPTVSAFQTDPNFPTRIHVINMHTGEVIPQKFTTEAQFSFHHINAYEQVASADLTNLIVDICSFDSKHFTLQNLTYEALHTGSLQNTPKAKSVARRVHVPISKSSRRDEEIYCKIETLHTSPFEFPTINYERNGLEYKYVYGTNSLYSKPFEVIKLNVKDPADFLTAQYFKEGENVVPSEAIFVSNPNPQSEDDGVLLVMVLSDDVDYLSVLDAKDLKEIARADLPKDVKGTFTFHGFFAEKAKMF